MSEFWRFRQPPRSILPRRLRWTAAVAGAAVLAGVPAGVSAYLRLRDQTRRAALTEFLHDPLAGDEGFRSAFPESREVERGDGSENEIEGDDALRRMVMNRILWGVPTPESTANLARVAYEESQRWSHLAPTRN